MIIRHEIMAEEVVELQSSAAHFHAKSTHYGYKVMKVTSDIWLVLMGNILPKVHGSFQYVNDSSTRLYCPPITFKLG